MDAWAIVGRRSEDVAFLAKAQPPSVVVGHANELESFHSDRMRLETIGRIVRKSFGGFVDRIGRCRRVRSSPLHLEAPKTLSKAHLPLAVDDRCGIVIALHAPYPIVRAILKIPYSAMRVSHGPTCDQNLTEVGRVVAVDIFEIDSGRSILHDDPSAIADQRGGNA